ncbi:MAG: divalent cation tolerance protein CutA [Candidatus Micrarchaeia archaeon]
MQQFFQALISATTEKEAEKILAQLVGKKLVAGGMITNGSSLYWWNKKPVKRVYWNLSAFTPAKNKRKIIAEVRKIHSDEVPIIAFFKNRRCQPRLPGMDLGKHAVESATL